MCFSIFFTIFKIKNKKKMDNKSNFFFVKTKNGKQIHCLNNKEKKLIKISMDSDGNPPQTTDWISYKHIDTKEDLDKLVVNSFEKKIGHNPFLKQNSKFLFETYNLSPDKFEGHKFDHDWYGDKPTFKDGFFMFTPSDGSTGYIPNKAYYEQTKQENFLVGVPFHKVEKIKVNKFKIAYTEAFVSKRKAILPDSSDNIPIVILLHGVPTQKNQKYEVMKHLGNRFYCIAPDMFGMGESDQPHNYSSPYDETEYGRHSKWDWNHDVDWINQLITHVKEIHPVLRTSKIIFQADDWGAAIALHTAAASGAGKFTMDKREYRFDHEINMIIIVNGILLDGHYVREIGAIGRASNLESEEFTRAMGDFDQTAVQIEKLMIYKRSKMNNYTERDFLGQYAEVDYQSGTPAVYQGIKYWNVKTLADRSSRLNPLQIQPKSIDEYGREWGIDYSNIKIPSCLIWGMKDQMMPPTQLDRMYYLLTLNHQRCYLTEIDSADHFSEWDRPDAVARAMIRNMRTEFGPSFGGIFVGNDPKGVYKGDERRLIERLSKIL